MGEASKASRDTSARLVAPGSRCVQTRWRGSTPAPACRRGPPERVGKLPTLSPKVRALDATAHAKRRDTRAAGVAARPLRGNSPQRGTADIMAFHHFVAILDVKMAHARLLKE